MWERGKPFCDGIKKNQRQHCRAENKAKPVQLPCAKNSQPYGKEKQRPCVRLPNKRMPVGRARILLVDLPVHQPVEAHCRRPRRHHAKQNPPKHPERWHASSSHRHRDQRKREGKHGVRELDELSESEEIGCGRLEVLHECDETPDKPLCGDCRVAESTGFKFPPIQPLIIKDL